MGRSKRRGGLAREIDREYGRVSSAVPKRATHKTPMVDNNVVSPTARVFLTTSFPMLIVVLSMQNRTNGNAPKSIKTSKRKRDTTSFQSDTTFQTDTSTKTKDEIVMVSRLAAGLSLLFGLYVGA